MNATVEKLMLVVVGAVVGTVPVLVSTSLQARNTTRQRVVEQRLASVKDYSTACHRTIMVIGRFLMVNDMVKDLNTGPDSPLSAMVIRQMESVVPDLQEAFISLRGQVDYVNALFGPVIDMPVVAMTPFNEQQTKETIAKIDEALTKGPQRCADDTKLLVSRIDAN